MKYFTALTIAAVFAFAAQAQVLLPGSIVVPPEDAHPSASGALLENYFGAYTTGDSHLDGHLNTQVFSGVAENPYPGGITFAYTVVQSNAAHGAIMRLSTEGWADHQVQAFQYDAAPTASPWLMATRSPDGDVVGGIVAPITPGRQSYTLIVHTDAIDYTPVPAYLINGAITETTALGPVPEPAEYALMAGLGLVGFAGWRRYRRI